MKIVPATPLIGVEISDIDLCTPSDDEIATIDEALLDHLVVVFRNQNLDDVSQQTLAHRLGTVEQFPFAPSGPPDAPDVHQITTGGEAPKTANADTWHSDATFMECPPEASLLRAVELPPLGGDTLWASSYAAFESLSSRVQRMIDDMTATHSVTKSSAHRRPIHDQYPPVHHPVVRTHPETGRKGLFVNRIFTVCLDGVTERENETLLPFLCDTFLQPDIQFRLTWQPGTVVLWDNRSTQHYATFDYSERRVMRRILLRGDRPS